VSHWMCWHCHLLQHRCWKQEKVKVMIIGILNKTKAIPESMYVCICINRKLKEIFYFYFTCIVKFMSLLFLFIWENYHSTPIPSTSKPKTPQNAQQSIMQLFNLFVSFLLPILISSQQDTFYPPNNIQSYNQILTYCKKEGVTTTSTTTLSELTNSQTRVVVIGKTTVLWCE